MAKIKSKEAQKLIGHSITGYMDYIDFMYESGCPLEGNTFWAEVKQLKSLNQCHKSCGIVKVKIVLEDWEQLPTGIMAFSDTSLGKKKEKSFTKIQMKEHAAFIKNNRELLQLIFTYLKKKRVSQKRIAEVLGVDPSYVKYFVSGGLAVSMVKVHRLANILGMTFPEFLDAALK